MVLKENLHLEFSWELMAHAKFWINIFPRLSIFQKFTNTLNFTWTLPATKSSVTQGSTQFIHKKNQITIIKKAGLR